MKNLFFILCLVWGMYLFSACETHENDVLQPDSVMQDGVYEGLGEGRSGMIKVVIEIKNHIITTIRILSQSESKFAQPAEQ